MHKSVSHRWTDGRHYQVPTGIHRGMALPGPYWRTPGDNNNRHSTCNSNNNSNKNSTSNSNGNIYDIIDPMSDI